MFGLGDSLDTYVPSYNHQTSQQPAAYNNSSTGTTPPMFGSAERDGSSTPSTSSVPAGVVGGQRAGEGTATPKSVGSEEV